jgi:hypothetical protein
VVREYRALGIGLETRVHNSMHQSVPAEAAMCQSKWRGDYLRTAITSVFSSWTRRTRRDSISSQMAWRPLRLPLGCLTRSWSCGSNFHPLVQRAEDRQGEGSAKYSYGRKNLNEGQILVNGIGHGSEKKQVTRRKASADSPQRPTVFCLRRRAAI